MNLVASLIARNERARYLEPCIRHLQSFCDEIRVLDDASDDGTYEWLAEQDRVVTMRNLSPAFWIHEGRVRQRLLDWTLQSGASHILALDCDEFVSDGAELRAALERPNRVGVWTLPMEEIWNATDDGLSVRVDGAWRPYPCPILYAVRPGLKMSDRQLACGREPVAIRSKARHAPASGSTCLHFGWSNKSHRQARYDRYVKADGGRFHASRHLRSIMWTDRRVQVRHRAWPAGLAPWREDILAACGSVPVA